VPNKSQIMNLLIKAGANPNEKFANMYYAAMPHFQIAFQNSGSKRVMLQDLILCGMDINVYKPGNPYDGDTLFEIFFNRLREDEGSRSFSQEDVNTAKLLIFHGAKIKPGHLFVINEVPKFKPLADAIKLYWQMQLEMQPIFLEQQHKFLNEQLKEVDVLKRLSLDLINIIGGYGYPNTELTPQQRIALADRCIAKWV
jgi:hypothetical protein